MSELTSLQDQFQDYLLNLNQDIQKNVVGTKKVSAKRRLAIYENAYRSRLIDALAATYSILKLYMGDDAFEQLGQEYLDQHPSNYRSIRWFGDQLASFLQQHSEYHALPHLAELAQFEWAMTLVFDAADAAALSLEQIGAIPPEAWENMKFQAHPSTLRLHLKWNAIAIWQALSEEQTPSEPQESTSPITWILWRNDLNSHFCSLSEDEAWAIDAMLSGVTFGEICEGLCQWVDEEAAAIHAASLLKGWITAGLITEVVF